MSFDIIENSSTVFAEFQFYKEFEYEIKNDLIVMGLHNSQLLLMIRTCLTNFYS